MDEGLHAIQTQFVEAEFEHRRDGHSAAGSLTWVFERAPKAGSGRQRQWRKLLAHGAESAEMVDCGADG